MDQIASLFGHLLAVAFGLAIFFAFFVFSSGRTGKRWRKVADAYPAPPLDEPLSSLYAQAVVLHTGGRMFESYRWWVNARIYGHGVLLSLPPVFLGTPPIFIPYSDTKVETYPWHFNAQSFQIKTKRAADVTIIVLEDLAEVFARHGSQAALAAS